MKPIPIRRKGCKNVGWIWNETKTMRVVVKLHLNKPCVYMSKMFYLENILPNEKGKLVKV